MIRSFGLSETGPVRTNNEDCFLVDEALGLFVAADGMGGHAAGEVASRLAVEAIENFIRRSSEPGELSWPCGIDPDLSFGGNRLRTAIYLANRRVFRVAEARDEYTGMGTTVVGALVQGDRVTIGHVGDSRLYLFSQGTLMPQTRDDTWAETVLAATNGDPRQFADHPMRTVLTNVLGAREQTEIHLSERQLSDGDLLFLCTDGVHGALDDEALRARLAAGGSLEPIVRDIVAAAIERGSRDNLTAIAVRYRAGGDGG